MLRLAYFCIPFLITLRLFAPNIDTTSGPNLDKSMTITSKWVLDASLGEYALGSIAFREGLEVIKGGPGPFVDGIVTLGVAFPIEKILDLSTDWPDWTRKISLTQDLHLAEGLVIYLPNTVGGGSIAYGGLYLGSYSGEMRVIYLDGDVSLASKGQTVLRLENVIVDGQGHTLTLGINQQNGAILCNNVVLRNMTLVNPWNQFFDGVFTQEGTFFVDGNVTFRNIDFQILKGFEFTMPANNVRIEGTVKFGNFGKYRLSNYYGGSISSLTIAENSTLIIENSSLLRTWYQIQPFEVSFESDTSVMILRDSYFGVDNDRWLSVFAGWIGVVDQTPLVLTRGKIIAEGSSQLIADVATLESGGTARLYLGDGMSAANDINLIITPGSVLSLNATNTNCSIIMQNVH